MNAVMIMPHDSPDLVQQGKLRLAEWARWQRGPSGTGYPGIEPFARLVTPSPQDVIAGPLPAEVAATDRAVCVLRFRTRSLLWAAIEQYFLREDAVPVKCRRLGVSRRGFYRLVDRACAKVMRLIAE